MIYDGKLLIEKFWYSALPYTAVAVIFSQSVSLTQ